MSDTNDFNVTVRLTADEQAVVAVSGDLDLLGATRLHRPLMDALIHPVTVLDLTECTFVDSSGLRTVLEAMRRAESTGTALRVAGVGTSVVRVLELAGLLTTLSLFPDVETALKA
jgi:anti-sigma B factor antagonist